MSGFSVDSLNQIGALPAVACTVHDPWRLAGLAGSGLPMAAFSQYCIA